MTDRCVEKAGERGTGPPHSGGGSSSGTDDEQSARLFPMKTESFSISQNALQVGAECIYFNVWILFQSRVVKAAHLTTETGPHKDRKT